MTLSDLPALNAVLNGTSAVLLGFGYYFIRQKKITAHRNCMIAAVCTSVVFLASYLTYHIAEKHLTRFLEPRGSVDLPHFAVNPHCARGDDSAAGHYHA